MPVFFTLGLFSILVQVFCLREIAGLLTAHEAALGLGLSAWIFWTAAGLTLTVAHPPLRTALEKLGGFRAAAALLVLASGLNLILLRHSGVFLKPGLPPGLFELITLTFLLTLPAGLANGMCIAEGLSQKRLTFYWGETLGSAAGGLLTLIHSFFFPCTDPLVLCGTAGIALLTAFPAPKLFAAPRCVPAALCALLYFGGSFLPPPFALPKLLSGISAHARTTGARMALIEDKTRKIFIEDGAVLAQLPIPQGAEASLHIPLLAHKAPKAVMFTGPAGFVLAGEALKHRPEIITVSDPDRFRTAFIRERLSTRSENTVTGVMDARLLLKDRPGAYDVIFQTAREPANSASNRFFTLDFFRIAARALKPGGILAFTLPFSENYLPPERAYFSASILASVSAVFRHVETIPGATLTVMASDLPINLEPELLAKRYERRKITTLYATPDNLKFLLDPYRRQWGMAVLKKAKEPPLNTDLNPVAYFYLWKMWLSMVVSPGTMTGLALIIVALVLAANRLRPRVPAGDNAPSVMFLAGFWAMAFELICLFSFQNLSGELSWKLGVLFASFMAGSAAGAYLCGKFSGRAAHASAAVLALALTAGLYAWTGRIQTMTPAALFVFFMVLLSGGGFAAGAYFAWAIKGNDRRVIDVYYSDLAGAALGGFIFSAAVIPLAGLRAALAWTVLPVILAIVIAARRERI